MKHANACYPFCSNQSEQNMTCHIQATICSQSVGHLVLTHHSAIT